MSASRGYRNRRGVDRNAKNPEVLILRTDLSSNDKTLATKLLKRLFGGSVEYRPRAEFEELERQAALYNASMAVELKDGSDVSFKQLSDPSDFMIREHLDDFRRQMGVALRLPRDFVGTTFNYLVDGPENRRERSWQRVDGDGRGKIVYREPHPPEGVIIKPRQELGLAPYHATFSSHDSNQLCSAYAVQAGSAAEHAFAIHDTLTPSLGRSLLILATQLSQQFESS